MLSEEDYKLAKRLAEAHWKFLEKWLHMVFVDAFIHGFDHAKKQNLNVKRGEPRIVEPAETKVRES